MIVPEQQIVVDGGTQMVIWVPIIATVILALVGAVWFTLAKRVEKNTESIADHGERLSSGDEKLETLNEIKDDVKTVMREQAAANIKIARIETKVFNS